jgi:hypothetical protein
MDLDRRAYCGGSKLGHVGFRGSVDGVFLVCNDYVLNAATVVLYGIVFQ